MFNLHLLRIAASALLLFLLLQRSTANQRFCGKALPDALDTLCLNGYNSKIKKSLDSDDYAYNDVNPDEELPYPYGNSPFLAKIYGGSANLMAKTRRRRHGIYDECCMKGCTYKELYSYCL